MNKSREYYSTEEVAEILDLHIRTIRRFIREGKLKATRVGKQFRIAESDLRTLMGSNEGEKPAVPQNRHRRIVVSTTVDIDAIGHTKQERLVKLLSSAFQSLHDEQKSRRFDLIYYEAEGRLRLLINGDLDITNAILGLIRVVLEAIEND
jgi:excisionase family DNA binding protein